MCSVRNVLHVVINSPIPMSSMTVELSALFKFILPLVLCNFSNYVVPMKLCSLATF